MAQISFAHWCIKWCTSHHIHTSSSNTHTHKRANFPTPSYWNFHRWQALPFWP